MNIDLSLTFHHLFTHLSGTGSRGVSCPIFFCLNNFTCKYSLGSVALVSFRASGF